MWTEIVPFFESSVRVIFHDGAGFRLQAYKKEFCITIVICHVCNTYNLVSNSRSVVGFHVRIQTGNRPKAVKPSWTCFSKCFSILERLAVPHAGLDNCQRPVNSRGTVKGPSCQLSISWWFEAMTAWRQLEWADVWDLKAQRCRLTLFRLSARGLLTLIFASNLLKPMEAQSTRPVLGIRTLFLRPGVNVAICIYARWWALFLQDIPGLRVPVSSERFFASDNSVPLAVCYFI